MDKIFKFFPKAAQAVVSFQNPTFSPSLDHKRMDWHRAHLPRDFSGPIMSMIPAEARSKSRNFDTQEPTSPKVSCMGQVKQKKKFCPRNRSNKESKHEKSSKNKPTGPKLEKSSKNRPELKKQQSTLKKIFSLRRKSDALSNDHVKPSTSVPCDVPRLGQMRKYASSRDTLAGFDWTISQVAPTDDRDYYSDGERFYVDEEDDFEIPFSAPVLVTSAACSVLEPRKEINLWKRRTMAQPKPLQLNMAKPH